MKLELLICTLDERIARVPDILLPARPDISYLVSMQYTDPKFLGHVPDVLRQRPDVRLIFLEGKGLSRNRNHCLDAVTGDLALIVDDDCRYREEYFDRIIATFEAYPQTDVALFRINTQGGSPVKRYADTICPYGERPKGFYPNSIEIVFRPERARHIRFNEHFGLGSDSLRCGEEEVWVHDAVKAGLSVWLFPYDIVDYPYESTGRRTYTDKGVMRAKGAVNYHIYGASAWLRMLKFALAGACHRKAGFFTLLFQSWSGIVYYLKHCRER